jgi:hypothetical protein
VPGAALAGVMLAAPTPARADNCSGLSDCSAGIKLALAALAIALLLALAFFAWTAIAAAAAEAAVAVDVVAAATEAGFTAEEAGIIAEANSILSSAEMAQIVEAHSAGESVIVEIAGRTIQYEPGLPASGMTMFGEDGFIIGNEAFSTEGELARTVLHELQRLGTSAIPEGGVTGEVAAA